MNPNFTLFIPAATCEFTEIIKMLIAAGADASLPDQDGCLPMDSTDNESAKELLRQAK